MYLLVNLLFIQGLPYICHQGQLPFGHNEHDGGNDDDDDAKKGFSGKWNKHDTNKYFTCNKICFGVEGTIEFGAML